MRDDVADLAASWQADQSAAVRARCLAVIERLRNVWRADPGAFDAESLAALKALARDIESKRRTLPADAPAPLDVLKSAFGYSSFRPGQQEIIDAVIAGRDC